MDSRVKAKVDRLSTAVSNIRSALIDKGVDATGHGAEDFATDIGNIPVFDPDDYKAASGWSALASKIHPLSEYTGSD